MKDLIVKFLPTPLFTLTFLGFMVLKTTSLILRFQHKNRFWKICTESWDIYKNESKFSSSNKTSNYNLEIIYLSNPMVAFVNSNCFEYHDPYNWKIFFTYKGPWFFKVKYGVILLLWCGAAPTYEFVHLFVQKKNILKNEN